MDEVGMEGEVHSGGLTLLTTQETYLQQEGKMEDSGHKELCQNCHCTHLGSIV